MKKILAIALTLTLVFALAVSSSAALPTGWKYVNTGGASEVNAVVNADNSLSLTWGNPDVYWANLAVGYDVSAFNNNYTATVDVFVPAKTVVNGTMITGCPVVAANVDDVEANSWLNGMAMKLVNYDGHPSLTNDNFVAWGNTWNVIEGYDKLTSVAAACASYADLNIKAGDWNTVKVIVEGEYVTFYVNGVLAIDGVDTVAAGKYFVLGSNGDCGTAGNLPSFKNLVIKSNNGSTADVTAFTVDAEPAGPADIEVIAIAGAMIVALMAAAFVVKARKA